MEDSISERNYVTAMLAWDQAHADTAQYGMHYTEPSTT